MPVHHCFCRRFAERLWDATVFSGFLVTVPTCLLASSLAWAGYSSMCSTYASDLESAATKYNRAKSDLESARFNFEMACGPFGYSRGDTFACGKLGHLREDYRSSVDAVEDAMRLLKSAMSDVGSSCVLQDEEQPMAKDNAEPKKTPSQPEKDVRQYREAPAPREPQ